MLLGLKFWLVVGMAGFRWFWVVLGGCGWFWVVVGGFGSFLVLVSTVGIFIDQALEYFYFCDFTMYISFCDFCNDLHHNSNHTHK